MYFVFSYVIPKKKWLYIFCDISGRWFSGNSRALFIYLLEKNLNDIECMYLTQSKDISVQYNKYVLATKSLVWQRSVLRAEKLFLDGSSGSVNFSSAIAGRFDIVNLWHGDTIKKIWFGSSEYQKDTIYHRMLQAQCANYTLTPVWNEYNLATHKESFVTQHVHITWLPRYDALFPENNAFRVDDVKNLYDLGQYSKIYSYVPTWRDSGSDITPFDLETLEQVSSFLVAHNACLLIKAHVNSLSSGINIDELPHIIDVSTWVYDTQELLYCTDVLITDYSSVFIDYLLLERPIVWYPYDEEDYLAHREMYKTYRDFDMDDVIAYNSQTFVDILTNLDTIISSADYVDRLQHLKDFFHVHQDGKSCERVVSHILT